MADQARDSVSRFGAVLTAALTELESRQREIDDLNVFPVADGDTGRNMVMTLRGLVGAMEALRMSIGPVELEEVDRDLVVKAVARAALSSAHGNSGVILSQLIRGAARELGSARGRKVSPHLLARAMRGAADQGLAAIPEPSEGTILTVARDIAEALERAYPEPVRIDDDISAADQDALLAEALSIAVEAGTASVDRGPELLGILREKGVVDAGGYGLVVLIAGALAGLGGQSAVDLPHRRPSAGPVTESQPTGAFSFCVNFTLSGSGLDAAAESDRLRASGLGDSVLVVGDSEMIRVHVHTDDPEAARAMFEGLGRVEHFEQEDMREQIRDRDRRLAGGDRSGILVLTHDPGSADLFAIDSVGVASVDHGAVADAIDGVGAPEVVLVATSHRTLEAAGATAVDGPGRMEVVDAGNLGAALLALSTMDDLDSGDGAALTAERIRLVLSEIATAGIRQGSESEPDRMEAVFGEEVIASGRPEEVVAALSSRIGAGRFVTAVVDPSGGIPPGLLDGAIAELEICESGLAGWHCVLAIAS